MEKNIISFSYRDLNPNLWILTMIYLIMIFKNGQFLLKIPIISSILFIFSKKCFIHTIFSAYMQIRSLTT